MSFLSQLDPEIKAEYDRMEERRTKMFAISPHYSQVKRIIQAEKKAAHYLYYSDYSISATVQINDVKEIAPYLKEFSSCGWRIVKAMEPLNTGWQWLLSKNVREGLDIKLKLNGDVPFHYGEDAPDACRRVQVGTETREVPIYKVVCPDALEDDMTHLDNEMSEEPSQGMPGQAMHDALPALYETE